MKLKVNSKETEAKDGCTIAEPRLTTGTPRKRRCHRRKQQDDSPAQSGTNAYCNPMTIW